MRKVSLVFVILSMALTIGCAHRTKATSTQIPSTKASQEEVNQAMTEGSNCITENAAKLDDGLSPANVVGEQIAFVCGKTLRRYFSLSCSSTLTSTIALRACLEATDKAILDMSTTFVLKRRVEHR